MTLARIFRHEHRLRQPALICELSSVCQHHQTLADARLDFSSIRASLAQCLANQIAQSIHMTEAFAKSLLVQ